MKVTFYISGAKVSTWSSQPDPNRRHKLKLGHESVMRVRETASREIRNLGHLQDSQNRNNGQWGSAQEWIQLAASHLFFLPTPRNGRHKS